MKPGLVPVGHTRKVAHYGRAGAMWASENRPWALW